MMTNKPFSRLKRCHDLSSYLIGTVDKDILAEAARVLAIHLARYTRKYGNMPMRASIEVLEDPAISKEEAEEIAEGLELLAFVIAAVENGGQEWEQVN